MPLTEKNHELGFDQFLVREALMQEFILNEELNMQGKTVLDEQQLTRQDTSLEVVLEDEKYVVVQGENFRYRYNK